MIFTEDNIEEKIKDLSEQVFLSLDEDGLMNEDALEKLGFLINVYFLEQIFRDENLEPFD
jgi:hypothetical protein